MKTNNIGAFGQSTTHRKNALEGVRIAFYARKRRVKLQRKKPSESNVINFLERRGYPAHKLETFTNQL